MTKDLLGQLNLKKGSIYVLTKAMFIYVIKNEQTRIIYVYRSTNAKFEVYAASSARCLVSSNAEHNFDSCYPKGSAKHKRLVLVTYKDPFTGKCYSALWTNLFLSFNPKYYVLLYKNRWELSPFFRNQTELRAGLLFSDSDEGIKRRFGWCWSPNLNSASSEKDSKSRTVYHLGFQWPKQNFISLSVCDS